MTLPATLALATLAVAAQTDDCTVVPHSEHTVTGVVSMTRARSLACLVVGNTNHLAIFNQDMPALLPGDIVEAKCKMLKGKFGQQFRGAPSVRRIGRTNPPAAAEVSIAELEGSARYYERIRVRGTIEDISSEEVDKLFLTAIVRSPDGKHGFVMPFDRKEPVSDLIKRLLHAEIEVTGAHFPNYPMSRHFLGPMLMPESKDAIRIVRPAPDNPFDFPPLSPESIRTPADIATLELRTLRGSVVATWSPNNLIVMDENRPYTDYHRIELAFGTPLPKPGERILLAGRPETDTYRLNLSQATYRTLAEPAELPDAQATVNVRNDLMADGVYNMAWFGKIVRLRGQVASMSNAGNVASRLRLAIDGYEVSVDASTCPEAFARLASGCTVEITGACLLENENWRPNAPISKTRDLVIVIRRPEDVRVLARLPWWTARRLMSLVVGLMALAMGLFVWNRLLNRLVIRKSRQLLRAQSAQNASELRIDERTRLAIELHDTLSQNLAGVACQVASARNAVSPGDDMAHRRLVTAERMLKSCRTELRQVLSDLRSEALEQERFDSALYMVLEDISNGVDLAVRFNVPRQRMLDSTAHAILCIVRELAGNAVRHGGATVIRVAGALECERLLFSVRDNGSGFDPKACPGPMQGHFGLDGVRNRVNRLNGTLEIDSAPGKGTHAVIGIPLPGQGKRTH